MRPHHRLALGGLAAFAVVTIGFLGFAGSASAASTSAASTSTRAVVAASPSPTQSPDVSERRKIKAGVAFDLETFKWRSTLTDRDGNVTVVGSYDTKEEAQDNADRLAEKLNQAVMDGPGCEPPLILC